MAGEAAAGGDTQISLEGLWARVLRGAAGRLQGREAGCVYTNPNWLVGKFLRKIYIP